MNHLNIIPIVLQFHPSFHQWTIGLGIIQNMADETASALFHLGFCRQSGLTFDVFFMQKIIQKYL